MVFQEYGQNEEVTKSVSHFIGASTLEIQVFWFALYLLLEDGYVLIAYEIYLEMQICLEMFMIIIFAGPLQHS